VLYHNNGDGTFTDVTAKAGVAGKESGPFHSGATFVDYDRDGRIDLYVGSYVAFDQNSRRYCNIGGVRSSCPPSAYRGSPNALYHNNGDGTFTNVSATAHVLQPDGKNLSVGAADYENNGWLDLFIANGHVYTEIEQISPETHYKQHNSLFHNEGDGKFKETYGPGGLSALEARAGRGVAFADFDNDGCTDVVVANNGDPPTFLHNACSRENHFVNFKLVGTKSNRDGLGARVRLIAGKISQIREIAAGGSYLSQSDLRANFGLGSATAASTVEVTWPSGAHQVFHGAKADQF
jgi:hypothetical protein